MDLLVSIRSLKFKNVIVRPEETGIYLIASHDVWFTMLRHSAQGFGSSVGSALNVIGLSVQLLLAPTCYAVCFKKLKRKMMRSKGEERRNAIIVFQQ